MLGVLVRRIEKHVGVEYQHSLALHHPVQLFAVRDVHPLAAALPRRERRQRIRSGVICTWVGKHTPQPRLHQGKTSWSDGGPPPLAGAA